MGRRRARIGWVSKLRRWCIRLLRDERHDRRAPQGGPEAWDSAMQWITDREGWEVLGPGESQVHPAARLARSRRLDP